MAQLVIHTDGGSRGNPGPAAYGVQYLVNGVPQWETNGYLGIATNNEAEYAGIIAGLKGVPQFKTTWEKQGKTLESIEIRMDSNLVVQQVSGNWKIKEARMMTFVQEARQLIKALAIPVTLRYIPRAENSEADRLVNECLDAQSQA